MPPPPSAPPPRVCSWGKQVQPSSAGPSALHWWHKDTREAHLSGWTRRLIEWIYCNGSSGLFSFISGCPGDAASPHPKVKLLQEPQHRWGIAIASTFCHLCYYTFESYTECRKWMSWKGEKSLHFVTFPFIKSVYHEEEYIMERSRPRSFILELQIFIFFISFST